MTSIPLPMLMDDLFNFIQTECIIYSFGALNMKMAIRTQSDILFVGLGASKQENKKNGSINIIEKQ